jgi:hypothetical protein
MLQIRTQEKREKLKTWSNIPVWESYSSPHFLPDVHSHPSLSVCCQTLNPWTIA